LLLLSIVALCGDLSGCIILPIPVARRSGDITNYRSNIGAQSPTPLVQGSTTRRQVLFDLGEPDGRGTGDQWFTYQSVSRRGGLHWAFIAGSEGGGGGIGSIDNWDTARRLTIRFDERGTVVSFAVDQKNCTNSFMDSADCPSASGKDIAQAEEDRRGEQLISSSGELLGRYDYFQMRRESEPGCLLKHPEVYASGNRLIVTQHRLVWRAMRNGGVPHWDSLSFGDIEDVKTLETHFLQSWIPLQTRDGSCVFVRIISGPSLNPTRKARAQIAAAVTASRAEGH
jgi:outer membrane protein assembly factor BamE (lipoprotein component of BamABCDE complex)